jgi:magnesium chelatase family protein
VANVRQIQTERFKNEVIHTNSEMGPKLIKKYCNLTDEAKEKIKTIVVSNNLSARGYHKILKIGRTIADLAGSNEIMAEHIIFASAYRVKTNKEDAFGMVS